MPRKNPYAPRREYIWAQRVIFGAILAAFIGLLAAAFLRPTATPVEQVRAAQLSGQIEANQKAARRAQAAEAQRRASFFSE